MKTFYVTTPIYYANAKPHIGSLYTTLAADILARFHRLCGDDVFFLTGLDEHSQKTIRVAKEKGKDPHQFLDELAVEWKRVWEMFDILPDRFIRTTEKDHHVAVRAFFNKLNTKGDIYKDTYKGWYCVDCEAFYEENDLVEKKCPIHKRAVEWIQEENYFFDSKKYKDRIIQHIKNHPNFIQPKSRKNEILSSLKDVKNRSISRAGSTWGIPFPGDDQHRFYVWFEALMNYFSGIGYGKDEKIFNTYWNREDAQVVQLVGKDIIWFHAIMWPAMLMSGGFQLPKQIFVNGFLTLDEEKISKSTGNVIDPVDLFEEYGSDPVRYFLFREIPYGQDGDFSRNKMRQRYEKDLANDLGNLVNRVVAMTKKYLNGKIPTGDFTKTTSELRIKVEKAHLAYDAELQKINFGNALQTIWGLVGRGNEYIEEQKPWELVRKENNNDLASVLWNLLELIRQIAHLSEPFMPQTSQKISAQLGIDTQIGTPFEKTRNWGQISQSKNVQDPKPLFPKKED